MKNYREYDLSHENIKVGTDKIDPDGKYIVLANHRASVKPEGEEVETRLPLFSYTRPCTGTYDPSRYSEVS